MTNNEVSSRPGRAVALDMDGVLIDGMQFHVRAWQEAFHRFYRVDIPETRIYEEEGVKGDKFIEQMASEFNLQIDENARMELHRFKRRFFNEIFRVTPMDGATDLIITLNKLRYSLALVTGTGKDVALDALSSLSLGSYFMCVISGDDVTKGKPDPEPYLAAVQKLQVPTDCCLVIENAPAGIASAKAANMFCIALETSLDSRYLQQADLILHNHEELHNLILREYIESGGQGPWISLIC